MQVKGERYTMKTNTVIGLLKTRGNSDENVNVMPFPTELICPAELIPGAAATVLLVCVNGLIKRLELCFKMFDNNANLMSYEEYSRLQHTKRTRQAQALVRYIDIENLLD